MKRTPTMFRSLLSTGGGTFSSRILGLVRDVAIASMLGAGGATDAFFVAFRIPNFFRRLFAEGAFSQAFVPVMSEYRTSRGMDESRDLASHVAGMLGAILLLVTAIGILAAPVFVQVFAPGFSARPAQAELTGTLLRLTFPYLLFISLTAFASGILNTWGRFGVPAVTPALLNLSLIGAALWLAPRFDEPTVALALGVLVGGAAQLAFQLPFLWRIRMLVWPRLRRAHEGVRRVLRLVVPALLGASVAQVNLLVDTIIASFLVAGSVSWLYYSDRLVEFPLGVFGVALGTVVLPSLASRHVLGDAASFSATLDWALRLIVVIATPAAIGLWLLAGPMLSTVFQYGEFGLHEVRMASLSLAAYASGLVAFVAVKVLAPGFHARQEMRTPVRIAIIAMLTNIVLNLLLVGPLAHAGLALATSLSSWLNAGLLWWTLRSAGIYRPQPGWAGLLARIALAALVMGALLLWLRGPVEEWAARDVWQRVTTLGGLILAAAVVWFGVLAATGARPRDFLRPRASDSARAPASL